MDGKPLNLQNWRPTFLLPDESGRPEVNQSIDAPPRDMNIPPDSSDYIEYVADIDSIRILEPYKVALEKRLGDSFYVLQFRGKFSVDSVPNEWRTGRDPLLWEIVFDESYPTMAFVAKNEPHIFYFPDKNMADSFTEFVQGKVPVRGFEETLEARENLDRLLG